jgi:hypothetical protein
VRDELGWERVYARNEETFGLDGTLERYAQSAPSRARCSPSMRAIRGHQHSVDEVAGEVQALHADIVAAYRDVDRNAMPTQVVELLENVVELESRHGHLILQAAGQIGEL